MTQPISSIRFSGLLAPEEKPTGDGRIFAQGSLTHRRLPAPGMFARRLTEGHKEAVAVSRLEDIQYVSGRGWVGSGSFFDPQVVPEVVQAIYLAQQGVSRPSVDLEPDMNFEVIPNPKGEDRIPYRRVTSGKIMGFTFVPYTAFDEVGTQVLVADAWWDDANDLEIWVDHVDDRNALLAAGVDLSQVDGHGTFAVNTSTWRSLPVANREQPFQFRQAINRLLEWSGGEPGRFGRAFLFRDPRLDPSQRTAYRLPIADIIDGKLTLVPRAVFSAAVFMSGGHGGLNDVISDAEKERIRTVLTRIYDMLRDRFDDPRVRPPWQRGGRQGRDNAADIIPEGGDDMPTYSYTVNTETGEVVSEPAAVFQDGDSGDCGNLDTPDAGDLNTAARRCAADRGWAMEDGSYPIRSKAMHGAADLEKAIRAVGRGSGSHNAIRKHIMKRARDLGLSSEIPDNWNSDGSLSDESSSSSAVTLNINVTAPSFQSGDCPEGQVWDADQGKCVPAGDDSSYGVTAAGSVRPPSQMFANPALTRVTPLTIDEDGHVYGHLATWGECHLGVGNRCVTAPKSAVDYQYFKVGEVECSDGTKLSIGKITIGTGHADAALGMVPAVEHYDNTGHVVAVVNVGEDRFGIWVAGSLTAGVDEQRLAELRRSPLSGDWRRINGNLELVAALAVNSPGFPVLRASSEGDDEIFETLVAAGVVTEPGPVDQDARRMGQWSAIDSMVRTRRAKELLGG